MFSQKELFQLGNEVIAFLMSFPNSPYFSPYQHLTKKKTATMLPSTFLVFNVFVSFAILMEKLKTYII
jgi:hypothetical protein